MMKLLPSQMAHASTFREDGFASAFKAKAREFPTHLEIEAEDYAALLKDWPVVKYPSKANSTKRPAKELKRKLATTWPCSLFGVAARTLAMMRLEGESGVGDTIARLIGPVGGEAYKKWFKETFGRSCGCTERQEQLNIQFPYSSTSVTEK